MKISKLMQRCAAITVVLFLGIRTSARKPGGEEQFRKYKEAFDRAERGKNEERSF